MFYFVTVEDGNVSHFVEASSPGAAIVSVPGGESVRIALSSEIIEHRPDLVKIPPTNDELRDEERQITEAELYMDTAESVQSDKVKGPEE